MNENNIYYSEDLSSGLTSTDIKDIYRGSTDLNVTGIISSETVTELYNEIIMLKEKIIRKSIELMFIAQFFEFFTKKVKNK